MKVETVFRVVDGKLYEYIVGDPAMSFDPSSKIVPINFITGDGWYEQYADATKAADGESCEIRMVFPEDELDYLCAKYRIAVALGTHWVATWHNLSSGPCLSAMDAVQALIHKLEQEKTHNGIIPFEITVGIDGYTKLCYIEQRIRNIIGARGIWVTGRGDLVHVSTMDDKHLVNATRSLLEACVMSDHELYSRFVADPDGMLDFDVQAPVWPWLVTELRRRNLSIRKKL